MPGCLHELLQSVFRLMMFDDTVYGDRMQMRIQNRGVMQIIGMLLLQKMIGLLSRNFFPAGRRKHIA